MTGVPSSLPRRIGKAVALLLLIAAASGCSSPPGPPPLSSVLEPSDREAYARHLLAADGAPNRAHFTWTAEETGADVEQIARADGTVSLEENPFQTSDRRALARGAVVYAAHCSRCHGEAADGRGPEMKELLPTMDFHSSTRRFAATHFRGTPAKWFQSVLRGKTSKHLKPDGTPYAMPAFAGALAREQIWLAVTYLMSTEEDAEKPGE